MSEFDPSRRALFSRFSANAKQTEQDSQISYIRPPNALDEVAFLQKCNQCSDCIQACPHNAITLEQDYPVLTGQCDHCNACTSACSTGALAHSKLVAKVDFRCNPKVAYFCQSCAEVCPAEAIEIERGAAAKVLSDRCSGCNECQSACEFNSISMVAR